MLKRFLKTHPETALAGLTIFFVAAIGVFYFWGIKVLLADLNKATTVSGDGAGIETSFDLQGASDLRLKL